MRKNEEYKQLEKNYKNTPCQKVTRELARRTRKDRYVSYITKEKKKIHKDHGVVATNNDTTSSEERRQKHMKRYKKRDKKV